MTAPSPEEIQEAIKLHSINFRAKILRRYPQMTGAGIDQLCKSNGIAIPTYTPVHTPGVAVPKPSAAKSKTGKGAGVGE